MYLFRVVGELGREIHNIRRAATPTHGRLRDRVVAIVTATIGVDLVCAALALAFEQHKGQIDSYGSALFWTSTQLLTVSSQFPNPLTTPGRILDVFMEAYAITVIATLAAVLGAFAIRRARERDQAAGLT
jgi:hypothetical protein